MVKDVLDETCELLKKADSIKDVQVKDEVTERILLWFVSETLKDCFKDL
jgi:hypothetical protein